MLKRLHYHLTIESENSFDTFLLDFFYFKQHINTSTISSYININVCSIC